MKLLLGLTRICKPLRVFQCRSNSYNGLGQGKVRNVIIHHPSAGTEIWWSRSLYTNCCCWQISKHNPKTPQLALSHPKLYKKFQANRSEDNVPEDWDTIFTQGKYRKKVAIAHWIAWIGLVLSPFFGAYTMWYLKDEEDVMLFNFSISQSTEMGLFVLMNSSIFWSLVITLSRIPKRMYFNEAKDCYLAILPKVFPWVTRKVAFVSTDIRPVPKSIVPFTLKPWKEYEFFVSKNVMLFPDMCFRSGYDKEWLLRRVR